MRHFERWFRESYNEGPFTRVGAYPKFWLTRDGAVLSFGALTENLRRIATKEHGFRVVACDVNWENLELYCDETGKRIESAYAEEKAGK